MEFLIKIKKDGRGGKILQNISEGENIYFVGFFGDFILRENDAKKIFIATGTGLAPIYRMMMATPKNEKILYFSVSTEAEIFYNMELAKIPNLQKNSYVSRESVDGFLGGRIKLEDIFIDTDAEYYLCGNPKMLEDMIVHLKNSGCEKVYFEQFA